MQEANNPVDNKSTSPGMLVLQWLTYAFWGWLILGVIWLVWINLANTISDTPMDEVVPYAMAAALVLLPLAFVVDLFYRKREPAKKHGVASVLMVIHAVVFALFGIGALVIAVFLGLNLLIGSNLGDTDGQVVALLTLLSATVLYGLAFLRTLNPFKTQKVARIYGYGMLGLTLILLGLALAGPVMTSVSMRDDRRIDSHLPEVNRAINDYVRDNKQLPDSLANLDYSDEEASKLVNDGLVEYKKEGAHLSSSSLSMTQYRYQLCVDYEKESGQSYGYDTTTDDGYSSYLSTYQHDAGQVCYKLYTEVFDASLLPESNGGVDVRLKNLN